MKLVHPMILGRARCALTLAALCLSLHCAATAQEGATAPGFVELNAGIHLIHAELAATDRSRMIGLMHRRALAPSHGMVFFFPQAAAHCMWMRDTLLPLSVAFLDDKGAIVNIEEMKAQTDDSHCAQRPVHWALEMESGWFAHRGLAPGSVINGLDRIGSTGPGR